MTALHPTGTTLGTGEQRTAQQRSVAEERWIAITTRDSACDGSFWYSVRTTGVYCRPSCPSRLPRRENVQFYDSRSEAERAGFRPCRRCRPAEGTLAERQAAWVTAACRAIDESERVPSLDEMAKRAGVSRFHFHRVFKSTTGLTPKQYADAARSRRVRAGLERAESVTAALYDAGFGSNGRFYARAQDILGMTPRAFRRGGSGTSIRFAVGECWLGAILVAFSERGVCSITLGDDPDALVHELQDRFPRANLVGGDPEFEALLARVIGAVSACDPGSDLPLDIRGTAFQERVWRALREIPRGSTATYQEIAERIGRPSAVRAVAQACASNRLAVLIPCHRVVRTDGSLSGYRWGVERKRALLDHEASRTRRSR